MMETREKNMHADTKATNYQKVGMRNFLFVKSVGILPGDNIKQKQKSLQRISAKNRAK